MQHLVYDLKQQKRGATAVVTLDKQANVRLMDANNYRAYKSGRRHRYRGGLAKKSPMQIPIPSTGHWYVTVDLGGYGGRVRASVNVTPPPAGMLSPYREPSPLSNVEVRDPEPPVDDMFNGQTWDVFLSHASEDKEDLVLPLYEALRERGVSVWLDKAEMRLGDSLRRKIDQGIRASRFSVVVLSRSFFGKGWTNHELDGLVTKTLSGEQTMLPIWHDVGLDEVRNYSASLADKLALRTADTPVEEMARQIATVIFGDEEDVA